MLEIQSTIVPIHLFNLLVVKFCEDGIGNGVDHNNNSHPKDEISDPVQPFIKRKSYHKNY